MTHSLDGSSVVWILANVCLKAHEGVRARTPDWGQSTLILFTFLSTVTKCLIEAEGGRQRREIILAHSLGRTVSHVREGMGMAAGACGVAFAEGIG